VRQSTSGSMRRTLAQKQWVYMLVALGLLVSVSPPLLSASGLRINLSASMPRGLYKITPVDRPLKKGDLIAACAPYSAVLLGRERGYLGPGACPGSGEPVLKLIAAVEGDAVTIVRSQVFVNGSLLPKSQCLTEDRAGRRLDRWKVKHYTLQPNMLWLYAPSPRSWDSRYWGPVLVRSVIGLALPVWLFERSKPLQKNANRVYGPLLSVGLLLPCRSCNHRWTPAISRLMPPR